MGARFVRGGTRRLPRRRGELVRGGRCHARWAGKSLPTIYHWNRVADHRTSASVVPASNFGGKGPVAAGTSGGINRAGASEMAGNVKEWCSNPSGAKRYILGGAWNEPVYMFTTPDALPPFARAPNYGFRCIKANRPEDITVALAGAVDLQTRDLRVAKPVSDPVFEAWRSLYSFDHGDLNAKVHSTDDAPLEWRVERVSYPAAYGDERIPAVLFLPKKLEACVSDRDLLPGMQRPHRALEHGDHRRRAELHHEKRPGAVVPIYKSTYERGDVLRDPHPSTTAVFRDHVIMWSKDIGRSIDYLQSRPDIARDRLGFLGLSWGAAMAPLFLALEPRIKAAVLLGPGFFMQASLPEADPVNFAPRVRMPVLMLNGRFDFFLSERGLAGTDVQAARDTRRPQTPSPLTTPPTPFRVLSASARRLREP